MEDAAAAAAAAAAEEGDGSSAGAGAGAEPAAGDEKPMAFSDFVWSYAPSSDEERLIASGRWPKSHMRTDFKTKSADRTQSDGVHATRSVGRLSAALKKLG